MSLPQRPRGRAGLTEEAGGCLTLGSSKASRGPAGGQAAQAWRHIWSRPRSSVCVQVARGPRARTPAAHLPPHGGQAPVGTEEHLSPCFWRALLLLRLSLVKNSCLRQGFNPS